MYLGRIITKRLEKLFKTFPIVVLTGARQVGKSTLLKEKYGKYFDYVVFDPVVDIENARQDPELFLNNHKLPIILDEIQYAPELLPVIKRRIDRDKKPGQYLITGSQQWGVIKSMSESLAGRAVFLDLDTFSLGEIAEADEGPLWLDSFLNDSKEFLSSRRQRLELKTPLYEQLWKGFFPAAQSLDVEVISDFYNSYIRTYIERDVRLLADISDLQLFHRFFRLAAALTAQEVHYSQLGRELGITPQTSRRWLDILKAGFQWVEIPAFSGNAIKRLSHKPKGYLTDTGLICNAHSISSAEAIASHPLYGALFETAVVMEIRKQCTAMPSPPNLYHWRSHGGAEVDLILEKNGRYFPIEIKATSNPKKSDSYGIRAFRDTYKTLDISEGLVIAPTGDTYALTDDDYALPWDLG